MNAAKGCSEGPIGNHSGFKMSKESCFLKSPPLLSAIGAPPLALISPRFSHTIRPLKQLEGVSRSSGYSTTCSVCKLRFPGSNRKGSSYCVECSKIDNGRLCVVCSSGSQREGDCIIYHILDPQQHRLSVPSFMRSDRSNSGRKRRKVGATKK